MNIIEDMIQMILLIIMINIALHLFCNHHSKIQVNYLRKKKKIWNKIRLKKIQDNNS